MSKTARLVLAIGAAVLLLGAGIWGTSRLWAHLGGGEMSGHGWAALLIGVAGTAALSVGLMMLAFHSSRSGHDDRIDEARNRGQGSEDDRP